jgi:antirestriction protein ArdC
MDKNNNVKSLSEQVAEQMVKDLENGSSIFQKPWKEDGTAPFIAPYNAVTGKPYVGVPALILAMKDLEDPRWLTKNQARGNDLKLEQNPKGTIISFPKNTDLQAVRDEFGDRVRGADGKVEMENVKLERSFFIKAVLYNGKQVENLPALKEALDRRAAAQTATSLERAQKIIDNSGVKLEKSGDTIRYNPKTDTILVPDKNEFASEAKYYAAVIRELPQWTAAEDRVQRPMESEVQTNVHVRDTLRNNIAALMIGAELNIGYELGDRADYTKEWVKLLKDDPKALFKATGDAQRVTKYVLSFEQDQEIKEEVKEDVKQEAEIAKSNPNKLSKGDIIPYNDTNYLIGDTLKNGAVKVEIESTGTKTKVSPSDNLYKSLLEARDNPRETGVQQEAETEQEQREQVADEDLSYSM